MNDRMRLLDMKTYVVLARNRHFGRTADELNTTQPAISSRLASIERELGCKLVIRGDGRFALTADGERVLQHFETVLDDIEALKDSLLQEKIFRTEAFGAQGRFQ